MTRTSSAGSVTACKGPRPASTAAAPPSLAAEGPAGAPPPPPAAAEASATPPPPRPPQRQGARRPLHHAAAATLSDHFPQQLLQIGRFRRRARRIEFAVADAVADGADPAAAHARGFEDRREDV